LSTIDHYLKSFTHLNRAPGRLWTAATKKKAPHKPLLLLALLDLFTLWGLCLGSDQDKVLISR
jgi:hypothetical protein